MGKSSIAEVLSKYYKLHHIKLKDVISEAIAKLVTLLTTLLGIFIFLGHFLILIFIEYLAPGTQHYNQLHAC